jgi:predicted porin
MNKKLLTAAIAAVIAAPTAALANDVTVYGAAHVSIDYRNEDSTSFESVVFNRQTGAFEPVVIANLPAGAQAAALQGLYNLRFPGDATDGFDIVSRASRIGFKGTEDLANGLKAIWKMEFQVDIADRGGSCAAQVPADVASGLNTLGSPTLNQGAVNGICDSGQLITARNAYVGLAGGWGTFLVGRHDTPFKLSTGKLELFADTLADYNSTIGFVDLRTNSAIAYVSPSWSGLSFAAALVAPHVSDSTFYVVDNAVVQKSADADGLAEAYSLALTYDNAGFFATVAYELVGGEWWDAWTRGGLGAGQASLWGNPAYLYNSDDNEKWRVGLGWTGAGFTVGGIYEWEDAVLGQDGADGERWQISAGYTFGNNMIKAMYGQGEYSFSQSYISGNFDLDGRTGVAASEGDRSAWAIGLDHNFSKRTKAYILYTAVDAELSQANGGFFTDANGVTSQTSGAGLKTDVNTGGFSIGMIHTF